MKKLKSKKGFTLIELVVVLAVLGIIMAIAVPRFMEVQENAKEKADEATIEMLAKAAELYYVQNNTTNSITVEDLVPSYLDKIEFKTDEYGESDGSDLAISYSNGVIIIKNGTETVYP
ncbi:type II secretion system protein [Sedimentibacter sp.]|uniref:competence type IV pilus major pilin ComGC n=1 Tax=Sedimentibacter sp. TaxID=1960295 RepID=UPI0028AD191B|nr:type II secretion system protein [Sedimentibacter sp.]